MAAYLTLPALAGKDMPHGPIHACKATIHESSDKDGHSAITKYLTAPGAARFLLGGEYYWVFLSEKCELSDPTALPTGYADICHPIAWPDDPSPEEIMRRINKLNGEC